LKCWSAGTNVALNQNRKKDGRLSLLAFGVQFGKREIKGVLKTIIALSRN